MNDTTTIKIKEINTDFEVRFLDHLSTEEQPLKETALSYLKYLLAVDFQLTALILAYC